MRRVGESGRVSYSQSGEDILIAKALSKFNIDRPRYLDIGANDPVHFSNTYHFYRYGARGTLVEPNPALAKRLRTKRPGDHVIEVACGPRRGEVTLTIHADAALSTTLPGRHKGTPINVPMQTMAELIAQADKPDMVSLDVEGLDCDILKAYDFVYRPAVWCIETADWIPGTEPQKVPAIFEVMRAHGYEVYADTFLNTIFIDSQRA